MYVSAGTLRVQKRILNPVELEFQAALSYPMWIWGTRSPGRAPKLLTIDPSSSSTQWVVNIQEHRNDKLR